MDDDAPVIYGLEFQARALTAQVAETEAIRFLVGTQSLRFENQVHQIDFDDENNVINKNMFSHREGEIWQISASPLEKNILATCYNKTSDSKAEMKAALWRIPSEFDQAAHDENSTSSQALEHVSQIENGDYGDMKCSAFACGEAGRVICRSVPPGNLPRRIAPSNILWHPSGENTDMIALTESHLLLHDLEASGSISKLSASANLEGRGQPKFTSARWNPHHNCTQIATANDTAIRGWDLRSMKQVYCIDNAHSQLVRDLDFNPNKQYYLASCGDDCKAKFWDIRDPTTPLKTLNDHSHWIWSIRFNHFHDQLILTSSSDSRVILTNAVSISSEPFGNLGDDDEIDNGDDDEQREKSHEPLQDGIISMYEEHEDSVYAAEWSTTDPWLFASLSYDGRLVINRVPRATKYNILL